MQSSCENISLYISGIYAPCSSAKTLVVSYIGMKTQEVNVKSNLKIVMHADTEMLDEVVVVAYGTAKKESLTGSISVVDSKK